MVGKSARLQVIPQRSTQSTTNLPLQTCKKNQQTFFVHSTGVNFSSRNNFANLGSFAKVSVSVQSIIPCCVQGFIEMNRNGNLANFFSYV